MVKDVHEITKDSSVFLASVFTGKDLRLIGLGLHTALLGRPVTTSLDFVTKIDSINIEMLK